MTKQLREWTAPDGRVWVWNPDFMIAEVRDKHGLWTLGNNSELLDHADALNALRADPYVAPKGLREQIADALSNAYEAGRYGLGAPGWSGVSTIADAVVEMIDRERPALGEVDGEVLVGELVRRGYESRDLPETSDRLALLYCSRALTIEDQYPNGVKQGKVVKRCVLIAPERAG